MNFQTCYEVEVFMWLSGFIYIDNFGFGLLFSGQLNPRKKIKKKVATIKIITKNESTAMLRPLDLIHWAVGLVPGQNL